MSFKTPSEFISNRAESVPVIEKVKVLESMSETEMVPTVSPSRFSVMDVSLKLIAVGLSSTAVTSKVKVAESEPPCPSVTERVKEPIESELVFTFALGVKVMPSS